MVPLQQRMELFNEAGTLGAGQGKPGPPGWRALLGRLMAGVKALCAKTGSDTSQLPGRGVLQMVLIYGSCYDPVQSEATSCTETHRRCSAA